MNLPRHQLLMLFHNTSTRLFSLLLQLGWLRLLITGGLLFHWWAAPLTGDGCKPCDFASLPINVPTHSVLMNVMKEEVLSTAIQLADGYLYA